MTNTVKIEKATKREIQDLIIAGVAGHGILNEKVGKLTLVQAEAFAQVMEDVYATILLDGKKAPIGNLGYLETRGRDARKGLNPKLLADLKAQGVSDEEAKKQAEIDIKASVGVGFKLGKGFKEELNNN